MKRQMRHVKITLKRFSNLDIKLYILELIQSILKRIIDGKDGPLILPIEEERDKESSKKPVIFKEEPNGDKMTDREKLIKIEEALHKMRDNYRKIKANKGGGVQMFTSKDVGDLVCKDLDRLFTYMQELEGK